MKQYVGYSNDHSGSMRKVAQAAMEDFNLRIKSLKEDAIRFGVDTVVSVVQCSIRESMYGDTVNQFSVINSSIAAVRPLQDWSSNGNSTKLFDSVNMLIEQFLKVPDYNAKDVGFLLDIVTDGGDNDSKMTGYALAEKIRKLQATDKWTITFRVPKGGKYLLVKLGIPSENIMEFNADDAVEFQKASFVAAAATTALYEGKLRGVHGSSTYYANTANLVQQEVRQELTNVSKQVKVIPVAQEWNAKQIRDFVEAKTGQYILGSVHYQLTKKEEVQDGKRIVVWDRKSGNYYTGSEARTLLNLPQTGKFRVQPGMNNGDFEIFIQSNSVNRKLVGGTKVVIFKI